MRRPFVVVFSLGAGALVLAGCSSSNAVSSVSMSIQPHAVSLGAGDSVGRRIFRDSPDFALACTTTASRPDVATVDTNADGQ